MVERPCHQPRVPYRLSIEPGVERLQLARDPVAAQYAESMGSSENDTSRDTNTAHAMVSAKGLNHCPAMPYMNPMGTNTATIENDVAVTARPISSVASRDAV